MIKDQILADAGIEIQMPMSAVMELQPNKLFSGGQAGQTAREQFARVVTANARIRILPNPRLSTPQMQPLTPKFNLADAHLVESAQRQNLPVITSNYKLRNQVQSNAARKQFWGGVAMQTIGPNPAQHNIQSPMDLYRVAR